VCRVAKADLSKVFHVVLPRGSSTSPRETEGEPIPTTLKSRPVIAESESVQNTPASSHSEFYASQHGRQPTLAALPGFAASAKVPAGFGRFNSHHVRNGFKAPVGLLLCNSYFSVCCIS